MPAPRTRSNPEGENAFQPIADRMVRLRKGKGWTQGELAEKLGLSRSLVASIESGRTNINATTVIQWAAVLEVSTDHLLGVDVKKDGNAFYFPEPSVSVKLMQRMLGISRLTPAKQAALLKTIDMFLIGSQYEENPKAYTIPEKRDAVDSLDAVKMSKTEKAKALLKQRIGPPSAE